MTPSDLLESLHRKGAVLSINGDKLKVQAPPGVLTKEVLAKLAEAKLQIMAMIRPTPQPDPRYEIPDGWTRESWVRRLRYLSAICIHAGRAQELNEWADGLDPGRMIVADDPWVRTRPEGKVGA